MIGSKTHKLDIEKLNGFFLKPQPKCKEKYFQEKIEDSIEQNVLLSKKLQKYDEETKNTDILINETLKQTRITESVLQKEIERLKELLQSKEKLEQMKIINEEVGKEIKEYQVKMRG